MRCGARPSVDRFRGITVEQTSGKLTLGSFTKGFVAKLIDLGETAIYPKSEGDRHAFSKVIELLNIEIDRLKDSTNA